jgi:hypothetical protein
LKGLGLALCSQISIDRRLQVDNRAEDAATDALASEIALPTRVALVGNPNSGKTALFLSGSGGTCPYHQLREWPARVCRNFATPKRPMFVVLSGAENLFPVLVKYNSRCDHRPSDPPASDPVYVVQRCRPRI